MRSRPLFRLATAILGFFAASATDVCGQMLEFCDDFTKPCYCQHDPWEERIETERHDFTQSAVTVGRGVVQLESGYSYFYKDTDEEVESSHTIPEMLLRVGLSEDIEFRIRWNQAWQFIDEARSERSGRPEIFAQVSNDAAAVLRSFTHKRPRIARHGPDWRPGFLDRSGRVQSRLHLSMESLRRRYPGRLNGIWHERFRRFWPCTRGAHTKTTSTY